MTRPRSSIVAAAAVPARDLWLRTPDGVRLAATYRPGVRADGSAVLLLHGVGASRAAVADNAAWLAGQGYATLAIDFRGHGGSSPEQRSFGWNEAIDTATAFSWLKRRQGGAPIAVVGISMGGAASLLGRNGPLRADALVLQAVYPDIRHAIRDRIAAQLGVAPAALLEPLLSLQTKARLGVWPSALSPLDRLGQFNNPIFVIGGMRDRYTPPAETRELFAAAPPDSRLWLVPSGDHAAICSMRDAAYRVRLLAFLQATLSDPRRTINGAPRRPSV